MKDRNSQLKESLGRMTPVKEAKEVHNLPKYDTTNRQGHGAYKIGDELRLISMLNTLKIEPQFYRSENETIQELRDLVEKVGLKDPYFLAQCIVYSRCMGEGMRSINHLAAALAAPYFSGQPWAKRFYSFWNKKLQKGGCIFRPDDMSEIKDAFVALNKVKLTNPMRKGFANAIENMDAYSIFKYKKAIINIANLVHPDVKVSTATIEVNGKSYKAIDALMKGMSVSADTWEHAQSDAGQAVAQAVKEGKLSKAKAQEVLKEAKNDNWESLLKDGKLGILAAIRNLRNMMQSPRSEVIDLVSNLVSDGDAIRKGKVMPYQMDLAAEVLRTEFNTQYSRQLINSLEKGLELSTPNLAEALPGRNLVIIDCSGSMSTRVYDSVTKRRMSSRCVDKAALIGAMIAKSTNADIIRFGSRAEWFKYNLRSSVFDIAHSIASCSMGGTNLASAFNLIMTENRSYDRIFILSDNECNSGCQAGAYANYIKRVNSPYIYSVDLAAYSTTSMKNNGKVNYYYGYGQSMFTDIASKEFNPQMHIDKIRKIEI